MFVSRWEHAARPRKWLFLKTFVCVCSPRSIASEYHHPHYHHDQQQQQQQQHVPGLLQTSAIMAFQLSLSPVLLMSSLLGDSFPVTKLFRLSVYFVCCLPLLLVPQIFPFSICFSSPTALFICQTNCTCLFLVVLSTGLLYPAISITSSFDFFSVHDTMYSHYPSDVSHFCCFKSSSWVFCQCPEFISMRRMDLM